MNLPEMLESWIKGVVETKTDNLYSSLNERIEALVKRCESLEKDNELLASRMLGASAPMMSSPGDLSFTAQRIKELEDVVGANCRRHDSNIEILIKRMRELDSDLAVRIDAYLAKLPDDMAFYKRMTNLFGKYVDDDDDFRDRMTEFFTASLDGDDVSEKIRTLVEESLDDEIDNLEVKIRRG